MANENIQMIYWHTNVGNLVGLSKSLTEYYINRIDCFRENAQKLYGCRGVFIPAGTTPNMPYPNQIVPVILNWTCAAAGLHNIITDTICTPMTRSICIARFCHL